jgi:hypothetical protein
MLWDYPYSASSVEEVPLREGSSFADEFTGKELHLDKPWPFPSQSGLSAYKDGCTDDIRRLFYKMCEDHNYPTSREVLDGKMLNLGMIDKRVVEERRERKRSKQALLVQAVEKKTRERKRRKIDPKSLTNSHLDGTELGDKIKNVSMGASFHSANLHK